MSDKFRALWEKVRDE